MITFKHTQKSPRSDRKNSEFRMKIDNFHTRHVSKFPSANRLQLSQIRRIERELTAQYTIDEIDDEVLKNYFTLKLHFGHTPFIKKLLDDAKAITNDLHQVNGMIKAETLYKKIIQICDVVSPSDSTFYYWFERLGQKFSVHGSYEPETAALIIYLGLVRTSSKVKKLV